MECPPTGRPTSNALTEVLARLALGTGPKETPRLWSARRRCLIHRMEEMRSTDGQADATGLMRLEFQANGDEDFLDSVQPGNPLHARPSVFTSQLQTTQERLTIKFFTKYETPSYETMC